MMGRKKKYHTQEERKEAQRKWWRDWYDRNKEALNAHRMEKYYEQRIKEMEEKLSNLRK